MKRNDLIPGYRISTDYSKMDIAEVHLNISNSYWSKGIPYETFARALKHSMCFGVFKEPGEQVGFARVITDNATFAYLSDVYIKNEHQGLGLGKLLISMILDSESLQGLRRIILATKDAHGLYEQFGFSALKHPEMFMEIWDPEIYKNN